MRTPSHHASSFRPLLVGRKPGAHPGSGERLTLQAVPKVHGLALAPVRTRLPLIWFVGRGKPEAVI